MSNIATIGTHINAGEIAKLDSNNAIIGLELEYSATAGTETSIDVTGKSGVYVKASDTMKYSLDGGSTYTDFEKDAGKSQYLNKDVSIDTIKVKNDNDATKFVIFKG